MSASVKAILNRVPFTVSMLGPHGQNCLLSEGENAKRDGFLHVITQFNGSRFDTHFTEYLYSENEPSRSWVIRHRASNLPLKLQLHAFHEHVIATKQPLFNQKTMHYVAHIFLSIADQISRALSSAFK